MLSKIGQALSRQMPRPSLAGRGLAERMRTTTFALLGITAAAGLGLVAIFSQPGWPILSPSPIPNPPAGMPAVHEGFAVHVPGGVTAARSGSSSGPRAAAAQPNTTAPSSESAGSEVAAQLPVSSPPPGEPGASPGNPGGGPEPGSPAPVPTAPAPPSPQPSSPGPVTSGGPGPTTGSADPAEAGKSKAKGKPEATKAKAKAKPEASKAKAKAKPSPPVTQAPDPPPAPAAPEDPGASKGKGHGKARH